MRRCGWCVVAGGWRWGRAPRRACRRNRVRVSSSRQWGPAGVSSPRVSLPAFFLCWCVGLCFAVQAVLGAGARAVAEPPPNPRFTGSPFTRSWSAEDYGGNAVCQAVLQHPASGFIYVGSNSGLFEFDGARWRLVAATRTPMRSLAVDRRGRVWFATVENLWWFDPAAPGEPRAVAATSRLPAAERPLVVVGAVAADGGIYCGVRRALYFIHDGDDAPAQAWPLSAALQTMWLDDGAVHLALQDGSWLRLRGGRLESVAARAPEVFAAAGATLLTARGPVPAPRENFFEADTANAAIVLADGRLAFGTERSGLVVCDRDGRNVQRIDRSHGLAANRVHALCEDREGGVWLALHSGLARVQLDSPFAVHGLAQRFEASPTAVQRIAGRLFVTHTEGLAEIAADGMFTALRGLPGEPAAALASAAPLFTAAVLQRALPPGVSAPALDRTPYTGALQLAGEPGVFILGSYDGAWLCRAAGEKWTRIGRVENTAGYTIAAAEAPAGLVWLVAPRGLVRLDVRGGARADSPLRFYGAADGLPADRPANSPAVFRFGGSAEVAVAGRLFRYDPAADRFSPETRIAHLPAEIFPGLAGGTRVNEDADGTLWLLFGPPAGRILCVTPAAPGQWRADSLDTTPLVRQRLAGLYHDGPTGTLWLPVQSGPLLSLDLNWRPTRARVPFTVTVRRVETLAGTLVPGVPSPATLALTPAQTALRFLFAAPLFAPEPDGATRLSFRTRLDGLETEWTPWSPEPFREFTNLPWRALTFHVQARDGTGRESAEDSLALVIAAPWWATRWAWGGYALLGFAAVSGIVRLRTRALHARAERLEAIVAARTAELATKNTELTRLHKLELDEKTAARLAEEKTRLEMLRYQLNPHFLANSLAALRTLVGPSATGARDMIERLASFCRMALTRRDETGTVRDEIEMLRAYLDTERSRWREMLDATIEADPATLDRPLPPFLLLPLVENAIKYGGQTAPDILRLRVAFAADLDGSLLITVANTGTWLVPDSARADSTGIGLDNIRQRLRRHYPAAHEFTTTEEDGWVVARLRIGSAEIESPKT